MELLTPPTALEYVNEVRIKMGKGPLVAFPEREDERRDDAKTSPAARALGCSVIRWKDPIKPCAAMTKDVELCKALVAAGGRQTTFSFPQAPGATLTFDVTLPTPDIWEYA